MKSKAILLPAFQGNIIRALRSLEMKEIEIKPPAQDEVLLEITAAVCNPSDLAFIQGGYNVRKPLPAIPGFEGTGRVIEAGKSTDAQALTGKRVSFFSQNEDGGTWSHHITVKADDCIEVRDEISDEQAACLSVNPFTAYAMIEQAKQDGSKAIIQNAAAGQIGYFIRTLAAINNIEVINIVRKEEQEEALKAEGNKYVLCNKSENFTEELAILSRELGATTAFDASGGELSGHILKAMPKYATLYLYGALAGRTLSEIPALDIIFMNKIIRGFNVNEWKDEIGKAEFKMVSEHIQDLIANGTIKTRIQGKFQMKDVGAALMQYIRNMSGGKVLLMPGKL